MTASEDMGSQPSVSSVLLAFWASFVLVAAQGPLGIHRFTLGSSSNESCANVDCQQGTCVPTSNTLVSLLFPYECQCYPGWATIEKFVPSLPNIPSLPCNVPNCTFNSSCSGDSTTLAPASPSSVPSYANLSACSLPRICGHGTCSEIKNENNASTFKCTCDSGYANVGNMTGGYCVNDCEISGECSSLNLTVPGLSPPTSQPSPASANQTTNAGCRSLQPYDRSYIAAAVAVGWSILSNLS